MTFLYKCNSLITIGQSGNGRTSITLYHRAESAVSGYQPHSGKTYTHPSKCLTLPKHSSGYILAPVYAFHSAGQEGRRHFIEWEVATASIYARECFGKVKHFEGLMYLLSECD